MHSFRLEVSRRGWRRGHNSKYIDNTGPEPAILDWYGHCVRLSVNKLGGSGGMLSQEKIFKIRHSEIASEAMFGLKCY